MSPPRLRSRAVLVTGAGAGIGEATARRLAATGDWIGCLDIDDEGRSRIVTTISAAGGHGLALEGDVSKESDVIRCVEQFVEWADGIDVVVSNAGIVLRKNLLDTSVAEWDETMAVNLRGSFLVARTTVPHLARRGGALILVASVVAHIGFGLPAYTASKGGIAALVRELAGELARQRIRVNGVSPGTVEGTRVTSETLRDPFVRARTAAANPSGRIATTDDVVSAIEFLASPQASMITGQLLIVDGGLSSVVGSMFSQEP